MRMRCWIPVILRRAIIAVSVVLSLAGVAAAQQGAPPTATNDAPPKTHKFFDTKNIVLTVVETTALTVDGISTQRSLKTVPGSYEADPIAKPFVDRGWPGQIAGGALFISADVALRYLLHRKGHHRLERWVPLILTTDGIVGSVDNFHQLATNHSTTARR